MLAARVKLRSLLAPHGAGSALATRCGVTPNAVWLWKVGKTRPGLKMREQIERETGGFVKAEDWETARERAARLRGLAGRAA